MDCVDFSDFLRWVVVGTTEVVEFARLKRFGDGRRTASIRAPDNLPEYPRESVDVLGEYGEYAEIQAYPLMHPL
jgi:hypothetical protein